jgi:hypothetical protein
VHHCLVFPIVVLSRYEGQRPVQGFDGCMRMCRYVESLDVNLFIPMHTVVTLSLRILTRTCLKKGIDFAHGSHQSVNVIIDRSS